MKISFALVALLLVVGLLNSSCDSGEKIEPESGIILNPEGLFFESLDATKSLTIKNTGKVPLTWELRGEKAYLLASPFSGKLNPGEETISEIRLRVADVPEGFLQSKLFLSTDKQVGAEIPVQVVSSKADRWFLDFEVLDAVYDLVHDRILAITTDKKLLVISPETKTVQQFPLDIQGIKLSVHPDGKSLVVSHIHSFSHIEISSGRLIQRQELPFHPFELVLAANSWVYFTEGDFAHTHIYSVNLEGPEEGYSFFARIYGYEKIKLHPSGNYLLSISTVVTPADVVKYNIEEGWANLMYDSPYHGEYEFSGDFWFTPEGDRFFARSGNVFHFTEQQSIDLTHIGMLNAANDFSVVLQSTKKGRIYAVHDFNLNREYFKREEEPTLAIYDLSYKKLQERRLSKMVRVQGGQVEPTLLEVAFGFLNKNQDKIYLLEKGTIIASEKTVWAIERIGLD